MMHDARFAWAQGWVGMHGATMGAALVFGDHASAVWHTGGEQSPATVVSGERR